MAERYGNTEISSGRDISEIKSTLNNLATRLERTQLQAVTPDRKSVQFNTTEPTKAYSRDPSPIAPTRNFDLITGQRLNTAAKYDVITGARLSENVTSRQGLEDVNDRQLQLRNRSPSPAYSYNERSNTPQGYNVRMNRDSFFTKSNNTRGEQYNRGGYNRSYGNQQYTPRGQYNNRQEGQNQQNNNNRGSYRGGPPRRGMQLYRGAPRYDQGGFRARQGTQRAITYPGYTETDTRNSGCRLCSNEEPCLPGQCWAASMTCYRCQNRGHLASRCTTKLDQPRT